MLQKKRDEFRKEIRKQQINKYRDQRRKMFQQKDLNQDVYNQINSLWNRIEQALNNIRDKNYQLIQQTYNSQMSKQLCVEYKQDQSNFSYLIQSFHQLKSVAPYNFERVFTLYMTDKPSSERVTRLFNELVENQWDSAQDYFVESDIKKYPDVIREKIIFEMIKFIDTLVFPEMDFMTVKAIIDSIWKLLTSAEDILFSEVDSFGCLSYTISTLAKMLEENKTGQTFKLLQQKGIGSQLVRFIDRLRKLQVPLDIHSRLLHLIDNYLGAELVYSPDKGSQKIGEITIQTSKVNEKEILLVYCIVFVDKSQESLYSNVFACISKILQIHEFLVNNLKQEYWLKVCKLIVHPQREIQIQALNLLNDFTYHSQHVLDYLLKQAKLFDMLYERLMIEKGTNDHMVTQAVEKVAYVVCNALFTEDSKLKKACLNHHIWQEIFSSFHPSNKLFPLIMTMPYFFNAKGHKNFQKYLIPYLQTLQNFQWRQCRYSDSIKDSIMKTFYSAQQFWQEDEYEKFLKILQQYGVLYMVEDLVDRNDLENIKDIEIN